MARNTLYDAKNKPGFLSALLSISIRVHPAVHARHCDCDCDTSSSAIDAVGLWCSIDIGGRGQDAKLATGSSMVKLLLPDGSVVNVGGNLDVIGSSETGLVVGGEAPRVREPALCDGDGVVASSCSEDDGVLDGRNLGGDGQDTRGATLVLDGGILRELGDWDAHLVAVNATPDKAVTSVSDGNGVVAGTLDADDFLARKVLNKLWLQDDSIVFSGVLRDASLAVVVETPCPDAVFVVDRERVVVTACNVSDGLLWKTEFSRDQALGLGPLDDAATKLVLLTGAPGKDCAGVVEGKDMVSTASDLGDLLQARDEHGLALNKHVRGEAEDALIALYDVVSMDSRYRGMEAKHTRKVPQPQTWPSSVRAKVLESPAATWTKRVSSGKLSEGTAVGVLSRGFRPESSSSSSESLSSAASMSLRPPSHVVSLPSAP